VRGNVLQHSGGDSMGLWSDLGVSVLDNLGGNSSQSYSAGFVVSSGSGLVLTNNSASNTNYSFELSGSSNVELIGNNGSNSYYGLYLQSPSSSTIIGNTFDHDVVAFVSSYAYAVTIYHNNFVNDTSWMNPASAQQVIWDNGYPSGGNHWGNFSGPDLESGPAQNVAGPDGIVDLPMIINATNIDHYPLARPWSAATITFVSSGLSPGTPWSVHVAGSVLSGTTPSLVYAVTNASNGTLGYTVPGVSGYMAPSPASGSVPFTGSSALVAVSFSVFTYPISFHETGLANGTYWSAALGATTLLTATPDANTTAPNGTYTYSVANVTGYALTTPGGSLTVHSGGRTVAVLFVLITHPTIWNNRTDYHNNTVYKNGTNGTGGTGGNGGGGSNGGAPATKAASTGYSAMVVDALVLALAAVAVLAAIGFALWSRARHRPAPPGAQPWSPPATPPPSAINPPAGALGVAAVPSPTSPPVGAAGVPDWKEDP
ncbi:MAG: hypothetical protein L3J96_03625, partial [Thermoplasmata archaeon]|nr:hypothetical protein [Thermoplasmata archaeon]